MRAINLACIIMGNIWAACGIVCIILLAVVHGITPSMLASCVLVFFGMVVSGASLVSWGLRDHIAMCLAVQVIGQHAGSMPLTVLRIIRDDGQPDEWDSLEPYPAAGT